MEYVELISKRLKEFSKRYKSRKELVVFLESDPDYAYASHYFNTIRGSVNNRRRIPNKNILNYFKKMFSESEFKKIIEQSEKNPYTKRTPKQETTEMLSSKEDDELRKLKRRLNRELIYEKEYELIMKGKINVKKKGHQLRD